MLGFLLSDFMRMRMGEAYGKCKDMMYYDVPTEHHSFIESRICTVRFISASSLN